MEDLRECDLMKCIYNIFGVCSLEGKEQTPNDIIDECYRKTEN